MPGLSLGLGLGLSRQGGGPRFPASLFAGGYEGEAFDFTDPTRLFTDTDATTNVVTEGDLVARVNGLSPNGHYASQATAANRPLFRTRGGNGLRTSGLGQRLQTDLIDLSGVNVVTVIKAYQRRRDETSAILVEFGASYGASDGSFAILAPNGTTRAPAVGLRGTGTTTRTVQVAYPAQAAMTVATILDVQGSSAANRFKSVRVNGAAVAIGSESGTFANVGPIPFGNYALNFGARANGTLPGMYDLISTIVIGKELAADELALAEAWCASRLPAQPSLNITVLGDSTIAAYLSQFDVPYFIEDVTSHCIAIPGNTISQQQTRWNSSSVDRSAADAVIVQVGLNDLSDGGETAATVIARLQGLIDDINADTSVPIIIAQMNPCRAARPDYDKWRTINAAIAGETVSPVDGSAITPITGVDQRVTAHVAELDDGSGYLKAEYEITGTVDGIHENNAARLVIANAWRDALVAQGLL